MSSLSEKRLFLLDMDGTIYLDEELFPSVPEFLTYIRSVGYVLFLTNNSSRGIDAYLAKMERLGIPACREEFLTSTDAAIRLLQQEYTGKKVYAFGTRSFASQLASAGIRVTDREDDGAEVLLCGFDTELTFSKLEDAVKLLNRGLPFLATNPDWVCPTAYGFVPDCGSVCEMLWHATGRRPRVIGKPQPDMVSLALERTGCRPEEAVIIGDRIYTDVACGVNAGIDSVFVLSGEGVREDCEKYGIRPTWIRENIAEIYREIRESKDHPSCGAL